MTHLHASVMAKQVLYLGVSDTPAWVVVKANECKPWPLFSTYDAVRVDFSTQLLGRMG
jgi:hypothetical protein